jgi:hypothetical protein
MTAKFSYFGMVNSSAKIAKGEKLGIDTYVIYLAPFNLSGYQVCPKATKECVSSCLNHSGRVRLDKKNIIETARINRTVLFFQDRELSLQIIAVEIERAYNKAIAKGHKFAVRLNGTSDISPAIFKIGEKTLFELFPQVQFYDYTKVPNRWKLVEKYPNYHITFSYSGENWNDCKEYLDKGCNVAAVFNVCKGQALPTSWQGYKVVDGDISDYRPDDERGVIVGLRFKLVKEKEINSSLSTNKFVVTI